MKNYQQFLIKTCISTLLALPLFAFGENKVFKEESFQRIEAGTFTMGSPLHDHRRGPGENQVQVTITKPFEIMKYEVTQKEWVELMGKNPSYFQRKKDCENYENGMCPDNPVENVSWNEVKQFIKKLNDSLGITGCDSENITRDLSPGCYRLPTEAEWEYAVRGGTKTAFSFGDDHLKLGNYTWYGKNSKWKTHPVGKKKPNPFGLYDVHGNVWEWVEDMYGMLLYGGIDPLHSSNDNLYRVLRGGAWNSGPLLLRSALRNYDEPNYKNAYIGFRLVRTL